MPGFFLIFLPLVFGVFVFLDVKKLNRHVNAGFYSFLFFLLTIFVLFLTQFYKIYEPLVFALVVFGLPGIIYFLTRKSILKKTGAQSNLGLESKLLDVSEDQNSSILPKQPSSSTMLFSLMVVIGLSILVSFVSLIFYCC